MSFCRLYLSPYELSPSYKDIHNKFSVRYFLNLVLVDEEDRRYFKQQVSQPAWWRAPGVDIEVLLNHDKSRMPRSQEKG